MRLKPGGATLRRKQLDRLFRSLGDPAGLAAPPGGWLRAIRSALGLSASQLAARAELDPSTVRAAEQREAEGAITLATLSKLAAAMDCEVVYAVVPRSGALQETVDARAMAVARQLAEPVQHTMSLESQGVGSEEYEDQVRELAAELVRSGSRELWSPELLP